MWKIQNDVVPVYLVYVNPYIQSPVQKYFDKKKLFVGSINASIVHPREIFKQAYLLSASFMICVRNHPSGDPMPSREDIEFTSKLYKIANLHGIYLIDHIVIGRDCYYSFYENNNVLNNK